MHAVHVIGAIALCALSHCGQATVSVRNDSTFPTLADELTSLRIIGGTPLPAPISWMASLQTRPSELYYYGHVCGGSLIDDQHVLTAAHCIINNDVGTAHVLTDDFRVALGGLDMLATRNDEDSFQYRFVSKVYCHPGFTVELKDNDICVLRLSDPVSLAPVQLNLPSQTLATDSIAANEAPGEMLQVFGWGLTDAKDDNSISNTLQSVDVPIVSQADCTAIYGPVVITKDQLCAGNLLTGGKDACQGDSGGPAVTLDGYQVGIASYGAGCAEPLMPGVYTRVSRFADFISLAVSGQVAATNGTVPHAVKSTPSADTSNSAQIRRHNPLTLCAVALILALCLR